MGTRFLLTSDTPVPESVKQLYLSQSVTDTVVTKQVDGVPHRVSAHRLRRRARGVGRAATLRRCGAQRGGVPQEMSGTSWRDLVREGLAMRRTQELSWCQLLMAANTPMLLRAAMVEGRLDLGVMASGQVVGVIDDLPSCAELIERIVGQAEQVLDRLC